MCFGYCVKSQTDSFPNLLYSIRPYMKWTLFLFYGEHWRYCVCIILHTLFPIPTPHTHYLLFYSYFQLFSRPYDICCLSVGKLLVLVMCIVIGIIIVRRPHDCSMRHSDDLEWPMTLFYSCSFPIFCVGSDRWKLLTKKIPCWPDYRYFALFWPWCWRSPDLWGLASDLNCLYRHYYDKYPIWHSGCSAFPIPAGEETGIGRQC